MALVEEGGGDIKAIRQYKLYKSGSFAIDLKSEYFIVFPIYENIKKDISVYFLPC